MKSRYLISFSALALLVLLGVQYIFITETYQTKQKQFDTRFGNLVREGMESFSRVDYRYNFDSLLFVMDSLSLEYLYGMGDSLMPAPAQAFFQILVDYRQAEAFIRDYLKKSGEDPEFTYHVELDELYLLDLDFEQRVFPNSQAPETGVFFPPAPRHALLAAQATHQRNYFRISYSTYINFTNRSQMILREMWLILALDFFTLLLVFSVFILTLRNMLQQKRLSDMKTDFINNMTHELKTPLSTISVASSALGDARVSRNEAKVGELSQLIKKQNRHLSALIDRILDINIWERDQVKLKMRRMPIEAWIRDLCSAFLMDHPELQIQLDIRLERTDFMLDEVHMSTVIHNLLSNAVKYGNVPCEIRIRIWQEAANLCIQVSDNGPGIRKDEQKHLFEKFYRGKEAKQRVVRGLGLGLYYVRQIVEAHSGQIQVESQPGQGSCFIIKIPVTDGTITG